jgi:drug/metabolite transporter (DMT)-like permease
MSERGGDDGAGVMALLHMIGRPRIARQTLSRSNQSRYTPERSTNRQDHAPFMPNPLKRPVDALYGAPAVLLTLTALFWGGNAVASRLAIGHITPLTLVFLRWLLVLAFLWPMYGGEVRKQWPQIRPKLTSIIVLATLGFTGFNVLFYFAAYYTTAINIGILQGSIPVVVLAGAFLMHGVRPSIVQLIGVLITSIGVVVVATHGEPQKILDLDLNRGDVAMLAACALYAFYTVGLRNRPQMPGAAFFTLLALIAAITSLPLVLIEAATSGLKMPTPQGFVLTAFVAVFPSCLAQLFFLRGVDLIGPGRAGVFVNLVPVFAAALGVGLLGEPFSMFHAVALILVVGGIWLAQQSAATAKASAPSRTG